MATKKKVKSVYAFRSVQPALVEEYSNDMAANGWEVVQIYKEGNKFWVFFKLAPVAPKA